MSRGGFSPDGRDTGRSSQHYFARRTIGQARCRRLRALQLGRVGQLDRVSSCHKEPNDQPMAYRTAGRAAGRTPRLAQWPIKA